MRSSSGPLTRVGMILILVLCAFKFAVFPLNRWNQENMDQIFLLKKSISQKKNILNHGKDIEVNLKKILNSLEQASNLFWHDFTDSGDLLLKTQKMLEKTAQELGIKIKSLQWGTPSGENIVRAPVDLQISAPTSNILRFISEIESSDKFYTIDNMRLICRSRFPEIQVNMTVSAYGMK